MIEEVELCKQGDTVTITGIASRFGARYQVGSFTGAVEPGAFSDTLNSKPDILLTAEHDRSRAIARTPRSLKVWQDDEGLRFEGSVDTTNDSDARTIVSKIERGIFAESSFMFRVPAGGDSWDDSFSKRTIHRVDLHRGDVSVVPFGASRSTSASVTRTFGSLDERRALAAKVSSTGWFGPGRRQEPILTPQGVQPGEDGDDDTDMVECPQCDGTGRIDGLRCAMCKGTGKVPEEPEDSGDLDNPSAAKQSTDGRSALLAVNDGDILRSELSRRNYAEAEARVLGECRARRERERNREFVELPALAMHRQLLASYERLVA